MRPARPFDIFSLESEEIPQPRLNYASTTMKLRFLCLLILLWPDLAHPQAESVCQETARYFDAVLSRPGLGAAEILNSSQSPSVFLLGEVHGDTESQQRALSLMSEIRAIDPDYDCLFLEMASDLNSAALADYIDNEPVTIEQMASDLCKGVADPQGLCASFYVPTYTNWDRLKYEWAKKSKIKTYFVDAPFSVVSQSVSPQKDPLGKLHHVNERTEHMTQRIAETVQNGDCKKGFLFSGVFHNLWSVPALGLRTLKEHLKSRDLTSTNVIVDNLAHPGSLFTGTMESCSYQPKVDVHCRTLLSPSPQIAISKFAYDDWFRHFEAIGAAKLGTWEAADFLLLHRP